MGGRNWLIAGALLSALAALLHVGCIIGGPDWYRFFGAGEELARAAERGSPMPAVITAGIAAVLAIWSAYALSGAGVLPRLPLLRTALVAITAVYLLRGLVLAPLLVLQPQAVHGFTLWSSLIVLAYGLVHATGTALGWRSMAPKPPLGAASAR
ncbi:MAG TPA: hypothetical protein VEA15_01635 [Caulobacteraceae bacterium]|nr:hypothetical protein [Caulobacteraceae bacterium]